MGYFPMPLLFCCYSTQDLHSSFVHSLRQLLVLPCAFTAIYILRTIALLCHRDVTNPLKIDMDLFIGAIGLLQVPERGLQRNSVLCGHSATAVTYSDSRTKNDLMPSSLSESENTVKPFFCTNIRALWERESRESQK